MQIAHVNPITHYCIFLDTKIDPSNEPSPPQTEVHQAVCVCFPHPLPLFAFTHHSSHSRVPDVQGTELLLDTAAGAMIWQEEAVCGGERDESSNNVTLMDPAIS